MMKTIVFGLCAAGSTAELERGACAGRTEFEHSAWKKHNAKEIYLDVDTSSCGFSETPVYVSTLGGDAGHWTASGASEIHYPTKKSFRVYVHQEVGINVTTANALGWRVQWIAQGMGSDVDVGGLCTGKTTKGDTYWKKGRHNGVYVHVDTSECGFNGTKSHAPIYFPGVVGQIGGESKDCIEPECNHLQREEILQPTDTGFRFYLMYKEMTPEIANDQGLHIHWIGMDVGTITTLKTPPCTGKTGWHGWKKYRNGVMITVDSAMCTFEETPVYVASLEGKQNFWKTTGSTELWGETSTGFKVYVRSKGTTPKMAREWGWHVAWIAAKAVHPPPVPPGMGNQIPSKIPLL